MMSVLDHSPTEPHMALTMTPGETMKPLSPTSQKTLRFPDAPLQSFKSKLPPAVANVPADHIRGYVHNKRVNHYLVGSNLGEGSFAKVKEAFHVLVGEKVSCHNNVWLENPLGGGAHAIACSSGSKAC